MQNYVEIIKDALQDVLLFEMSYARRRAAQQIAPQGLKLSKKVILVTHSINSRDLPHWLGTADGHISNIFKFTFLDGSKRLSASVLKELVWDGPLGTYEDYVRDHAAVARSKPETSLQPPSKQLYAQLQTMYMEILSAILSSKTLPPEIEDFL